MTNTQQRPAAAKPENALAVERPPTRADAVRVHDEGPMGYLLDSDRFEHMQRIAALMAASSLLPKHLQGTSAAQAVANCFRVCNQAHRWGFDPFAIIDATYEVGGKLGYEGKLIAAVINVKMKTEYPAGLQYYYNSATGDDFACVAYASPDPLVEKQFDLLMQYAEGEEEYNGDALRALSQAGIKAVRVSVGQAKTKNDMWHKDPEQKLSYNAALKWARRHAPQVVMGVLTDDDIERMSQPAHDPDDTRPPVANLADLTATLRRAPLDIVSSGSEAVDQTGQDEAAAAGSKTEASVAEEPVKESGDPAKQQAVPGKVIEQKKEGQGEAQGQGEEFRLGAGPGATEPKPLRAEAVAIVARIGRVGSAGGLKRVMVEVRPSGVWTTDEKAAFEKAAEDREKAGFGGAE